MSLIEQVSNRLRARASNEHQPAAVPLNTDNVTVAKRQASRSGYSDIGGGSFRGQNGSVWSLGRDAQGGYQLVRTSAEADLFDAQGSRVAHRTPKTAQLDQPKPEDVPGAKADASEREALGLTVSPVSAYLRRAARDFALFGAMCADEVPGVVSKIGGLGKLRTDRPISKPVARWANLEGLVGKEKADFARRHVLVGAQSRILSREANVPFVVAYRSYPVVAAIPHQDQTFILKAAKGEQKYLKYVATHYPGQLDQVRSFISRYKASRLAFGPLMAGDPMEKDCSYCSGSNCVPKNGGRCASCGESNSKIASPWEYGVDTYNDGIEEGKEKPWMNFDTPKVDLEPKDCPMCGSTGTLMPNSIGEEFDCTNCGAHLITDIDSPGTLYDMEGNQVGSFTPKTAAQCVNERRAMKARWDRMSAADQAALMMNPRSPYFDPRGLDNKGFNRLWASLVQNAQAMMPPPPEEAAQKEASPWEYGVDTYNDGEEEEGGFWDVYLNGPVGDRFKDRPGEPDYPDQPGEFDEEPAAPVTASLLSRIPRIAVDDAAKRYWQTYFGDYGSTWVGDVKRRLRADLISASLKATGVDQAAADYYGEYFGDYGEDLVEEKARSLKSKAGKTAQEEYGYVMDPETGEMVKKYDDEYDTGSGSPAIDDFNKKWGPQEPEPYKPWVPRTLGGAKRKGQKEKPDAPIGEEFTDANGDRTIWDFDEATGEYTQIWFDPKKNEWSDTPNSHGGQPYERSHEQMFGSASEGDIIMDEKVGAKRVVLRQAGTKYVMYSPAGRVETTSREAALKGFRDVMMQM